MDLKNIIKISAVTTVVFFLVLTYVNLAFEGVYWFNVFFTAFACILVGWLLFILSLKVRRIDKLIEVAESLANGEFNVNIDYNIHKKDSINNLAINLTVLRDTLKRILKEIDNLSILHERGEIDRVIDYVSYKGLYQEVASNISRMGQKYRTMTEDVITSLIKMANGDFEVSLQKYEGQKEALNTSMELLTSNLKEINTQIKSLIKNVDNGNLCFEIESKNFEGDWREILEGLNNILISFTNPITEMNLALNSISSGVLTTQMDGYYKGEFLEIQKAINTTANKLYKSIRDIDIALTEVAGNNLTVKIDDEEHTTNISGNNDIAEMKKPINNIIEKFAHVLKNIREGSIYIDEGTKMIAGNAEELATGAVQGEQAIEELSCSIVNVSSIANSNAEKAETASVIAKLLEEESHKNIRQMGEMVVSMKEIEKSSENIINIIKAVDDISFQTSILALNASIEAARAGEHGRGFAIVAEEVRILSQRTTNLTDEITEVINASSQKIKEGTEIVKIADSSLKDMVEKIDEVNNNISEISQSSVSQARDIVNIRQAFGEVSSIISGNQQTSTVLHESTTELKNLSENLKEMVSDFVLE